MLLKEFERIGAVNKYLKINFSLEMEIQKVLKTAAMIFDCPTALISLSVNMPSIAVSNRLLILMKLPV